MSKGGKTQTVTTKQQMDPWLKSQWMNLYGQMNRNAPQGYEGQLAAGMTPDQMAARETARGMGPGSQGFQAVEGGIRGTHQAMGYNPLQVSANPAAGVGGAGDYGIGAGPGVSAGQATAAQTSVPTTADNAGLLRGAVRDVAGQTGAAGMDPYRNAYESQVVQGAIGDLDRARQMADNDVAASASRAGAFGGSRHGLLQAENQKNFLDQAARTSADLRHRGFETAAQHGQADAGRMLQAGGMNQGADQAALGMSGQIGMDNTGQANQVGVANAGYQTQASMANARNALQRGNLGLMARGQDIGLAQFNAGLDMDAQRLNQAAGLNKNNQLLQGGAQLGMLGQGLQGMGMGHANQMNAYGTQEQGINQNALSADYGEFQRQQQAQMAHYAQRQQALGGMMPGMMTATQSQPMQRNVGAGILGGAAAGFGMFGGPWGAIGGGLLGAFG